MGSEPYRSFDTPCAHRLQGLVVCLGRGVGLRPCSPQQAAHVGKGGARVGLQHLAALVTTEELRRRSGKTLPKVKMTTWPMCSSFHLKSALADKRSGAKLFRQ